MPVNAVAENVLGTIGTICWTLQIVPQIWKSWREKSTEGLSPWLMFIWAISGIPLGVYVIVQNINIPLILQPQLFTALSTVSWMQCLYYGHKRSLLFCVLLYVAYIVAFAGTEVGLAIAVKAITNNGNHRPLEFLGIFSAVLISIALLPQYVEIWRRKEVVGLSTLFMTIDFAGAVFCLLSLAFKPRFDFVAAITYVMVLILDGIIILAAIILNPLARRRRGRAEEVENLDKEKGCRNTVDSEGLPSPKSDASTTVEDAGMAPESPNGKEIELNSGEGQDKGTAQS
ncbi:hypothetical protein FRC01_002425 [Tulasnella sp. 417]|nr:hypothetical protein FRC01_002425 [Tulasnella sp. 417]